MTTGERNDREADGTWSPPESLVRGAILSAGPARDSHACPAFFVRRGPLLVALLAWLSVIATLDPAGSYPWLAEGPGLTLDELFNVEMGVYQFRAQCETGLAPWWNEAARNEVFAPPDYNPDHPPLGRLWLGAWHDLTRFVAIPRNGNDMVTACARTGSAAAFALTVFLAGWIASRWYGRSAGWIAALSLTLMPHVWAHAHIAALETCMGLVFAAVVFYVGDRGAVSSRAAGTSPGRGPGWAFVAIAGLLWGLALLTKVQAILLPVPLTLWLVARWRLRGLLLAVGLGLVGGLTFFVGWPWLWLDPAAHLREHFFRDRPTLYCWYFGRRYADVDVPWHYSLVLFAVTVPVGLHLLAAWGSIARCRASDKTADEAVAEARAWRTRLLLLTVLFVLLFFALPGIPVYDGTRLFLVVMPLWGVLAGAGGSALWNRAATWRFPRLARGALLLLLAAQGWGLITLHPCQLSYYNLAVGGLRGADALGLEPTYWGDSITRSFIEECLAKVESRYYEPIYVAPVLHPFQLDDWRRQSPLWWESSLQLLPYTGPAPHRRYGNNVQYVLVFRRHADAWAPLEPAPRGATLLAEVRRDGVQLSALYEVAPTAAPP